MKSQRFTFFFCGWGGGGGVSEVGFPTFVPESKTDEISKYHIWVGMRTGGCNFCF